MKDKYDRTIQLGDILDSENGYSVIVVEGDAGWVGKLICKSDHSCENIPYALNDGRGYTKRRKVFKYIE